MISLRAAVRPALLAVCLLAAGCTIGPTPTPLPPHPTFATPTPLATAGPDNRQRVSVSATGVGVWQLVTIPVAVIHNDSTQHAAVGVTAHFTPVRGGTRLQRVDSPTIALAPGATVAISADCTDSCPGATSTQVTITVASWADPIQVPAVGATGAGFHRVSGSGSGQGTVSGTLEAATVPAGGTVYALAVCYRGSGIVGGGSNLVVWQAAGQPTPASVSVIVTVTPDHCVLYGAAGA